MVLGYGRWNYLFRFEPTHSYTTPGTYTISLYAQNHCGITNIITHEVCIEAALVPEFTASITEGCFPISTILTNTTNIVNPCTLATFEWVVNYIPDFCGTTNGATFINGTNATSEMAEIEFTTPGRYEIILEGTNACGKTSSTPQEIHVTAPPEVDIPPIGYLCGSNPTIAPIATVSNCSSESVTYFWSLDVGVSPVDWEFVNGTGLTQLHLK